MIRPFAIAVFVATLTASSATAQAPLTLPEAIARARARNTEATASAAAEREAAQRLRQARAGFFPRLDVVESWQRGNQPVFVFSSLLSQRRFGADDFALSALNRPDAVNAFRSAVMIEQPLFDATTRAEASAASLDRQVAAARVATVGQELGAAVTGAYGRVLVAMAARTSADAAADTARADRELAANRREAGRATDADVLQIDVYAARIREQQIRAAADERVARAQLNQLMGEPLDAPFVLQPAAAIVLDTSDLASLAAEAAAKRPEVAAATLQQRLSENAVSAARAAWLPRITADAGWEFNGGTWATRASSWIVGATGRINLFRGFGDRARLAEAREMTSRRAAEREHAESAARLDVYVAAAQLDAARASVAAGRTAVAQAHESRRIIRDRYEAGLTDAAALLRATEAVVQAETQQITAEVAVLTGTAALERALGRQ